ncbi:type I-C CRISPR-associated protein Cas8c/Csd1 [Paenibacillus hunanensis]|uniref:CRISPR-associated protein Csd1 n=1 Tax=Paenibacillus hunanensis TaxID=539262 RepID=A0ABU1IWI2_9BACL|nr:type I-C CRISPR-associated protein Cas8c/Csd1 [Paenibacillus hunanensis]MDR6243611.1 CRISPR-associated protein Csd1 [Paenibacillus hunanensis]GGJ23370.1 type I-C CRISPR-associated protein Cas8c/Csd1 [Paenibacillus hunanensis]
MILQSLYKRYEQLLEDPDSGMSKPGYSLDKVSFVLEINENGDLLNIVDIRIQQGKKQIPPRLTVPEHSLRTSAIKPFFLSDKAEYILGIVADKEAGFKVSLSKYQGSADLHHRLLATCQQPEARAIIQFYEQWSPQNLSEHSPWYSDLLKIVGTTDNNLVFRLHGAAQYIHEVPTILEVWDHFIRETEADNDLILGHCLITGESDQPIAKIHKVNIKGVQNAQSSGASIVSFNFPALESYGKKQNYNAPVSEMASIGYAKALNHLLLSDRNRLRQMGDMTVVFWAERLPGESQQEWELQESVFSSLFEEEYNALSTENKQDHNVQDSEIDNRNNNEQTQSNLGGSRNEDIKEDRQVTRQIADLLSRVKRAEQVSADMLPAQEASFYVLGMSGNNARLSIRFFWQSSFRQLFDKLSLYAADMEIQRPGKTNADLPTLFHIMLQTVRQTNEMSKMRKSISGAMESEWFRAILSGSALPYSVYAAIVGRTRVDGRISPYGEHGRAAWVRASVIKAYLTRYARMYKRNDMKEALTPMLNEEAQSVAYRLGRLFAVLERAQTDAAGQKRLNATIKDRYFGSASSTPASVFPILLRLAQHHMSKAEYGKSRDREIGSILQGVDAFPNHLDLKQQGLFMLGYYHQAAYRAPAHTTDEGKSDAVNLSEPTTDSQEV